ncbi:hypothetical protein A5778_22480 [Mycolicibacterium monacense]|nr:hypothetical protein A5778_22480 [Mycolicibacterium monacense]
MSDAGKTRGISQKPSRRRLVSRPTQIASGVREHGRVSACHCGEQVASVIQDAVRPQLQVTGCRLALGIGE